MWGRAGCGSAVGMDSVGGGRRHALRRPRIMRGAAQRPRAVRVLILALWLQALAVGITGVRRPACQT